MPTRRCDESSTAEPRSDSLGEKVGRIVAESAAAALLLVVFVGANFVAATFLTWLPMFIFESFDLGLDNSSFTSTFWPLASLPGAILRRDRRRPGGATVARAAGSGCRAWA